MEAIEGHGEENAENNDGSDAVEESSSVEIESDDITVVTADTPVQPVGAPSLAQHADDIEVSTDDVGVSADIEADTDEVSADDAGVSADIEADEVGLSADDTEAVIDSDNADNTGTQADGSGISEPSAATVAEAKRAIEAIILVTTDPISSQLLAQLLEIPTTVVNNLVAELAGEYDAESRGFELVGVAGGWRFQTRADLYEYVERFALEGFGNKLSKAALETLSIVAYKQPISRSQITAIRGVNADGVLKTLEQRGYVEETGRDDGPGQAMLFGTTMFFLERLGINSVEDLPPLGDFVPSAEVLEILEESLRIEDTPEPDASVDDGVDGVDGVDDGSSGSFGDASNDLTEEE